MLPPLPTLPGERVILREPRDSDVDDRLRHSIDPEEEDNYGSSWRREWDGRRYHAREHLTATRCPPDPGTYTWGVEYDGHCIGSAGLRVDPDQHCATYTVGLFVAALRGRGLSATEDLSSEAPRFPVGLLRSGDFSDDVLEEC